MSNLRCWLGRARVSVRRASGFVQIAISLVIRYEKLNGQETAVPSPTGDHLFSGAVSPALSCADPRSAETCFQEEEEACFRGPRETCFQAELAVFA